MAEALRRLRSHRNSPIILLLIIFAVLASVYSVATPLFEMSDELWHYPMVKTIADGNGLPIQDPANPGPWKQEGSQPPLYYLIAGALTSWIDTSDVGQVLRPNPHVDNGLITKDGNHNLVLHNQRRETEPWRGTVLAVHVARLVSVVFGTGAVYFTFLIGREIFPEIPWLSVAGAATVAFTPMFAFISGAVNNDSLAVMLTAAGLWLMMRIVSAASGDEGTLKWTIALGIVLGLSALTKTSALGQFGLAGVTMAYAAHQKRRWQVFFLEGPLILVIAAAIAGWWYYRNFVLYGDLLGLNVFIEILGRRARPASLLQLWGERFGFMQSYWGLFGGVNVPMPEWVYAVLNWLSALSVLGALAVAIMKLRSEGVRKPSSIAAILSFLWIAGVVIPLVASWARITWSSQGRLVFPALTVINIWFIAGLTGWLPKRMGMLIAGMVLTFLGVLSVLAPLLWIRPAYALPEFISADSDSDGIDFYAPGVSEPGIRLVEALVNIDSITPGEFVPVILTWESVNRMDRNWSVFIHLEDSAGLLAGQRDTYPGVGTIATSELEPGLRWTSTYLVPASITAYSPETLRIRVGLYDFDTCSACVRMTTHDGADSVIVGTISLQERAGESAPPNSTSLNFSREMLLRGFDLSQREAQAGDTINVTLYWSGLSSMENNYTVSLQLLDDELRQVAQSDVWPLQGNLPTTAWQPNQEVVDTMTLEISQDATPGVYNLQLVIYFVDDKGEINRLQLVTPDGRLVDDFVRLTQVRVVD